jgi:hypothetical protein
MQAPIAERKPVELTLHGETRTDDYYWLRERENPEVTKYLEAENAYTEAVMAPAKRSSAASSRPISTSPSNAATTSTTRGPSKANSTPSSAATKRTGLKKSFSMPIS